MLLNGLFSLSLLNIVISIVLKVFLCMAVYKDAKERDDKNVILWTVLVAIFGLMPLLIYVLFRFYKENKYVICPHCGKMISKDYPVCAYCKQPINDKKDNEFVSAEVKKLLIICGVLFVIKIIIENVFLVANTGAGEFAMSTLFF